MSMTAKKKLWEWVFPTITEGQAIHLLETEFNRPITPILKRAFAQAKQSHENQLRDTGEPYLNQHIYPVMLTVVDYFTNHLAR
jgi:(p)ppGpp synthase/HD superfamily hydrolase